MPQLPMAPRQLAACGHVCEGDACACACAQVLGQPVTIHVGEGAKVTSRDPALNARVSKAVHRVLEAMRPVPVEL